MEADALSRPQFEVRICPALRNKAQATADALAKVQARKAAPTDTPSSSSDKAIAGKPKSSPFEPPYVEELFVGEVPPVEEDDEGMAVLVRDNRGEGRGAAYVLMSCSFEQLNKVGPSEEGHPGLLLNDKRSFCNCSIRFFQNTSS